MTVSRYEKCIVQRDNQAIDFIRNFLSEAHRNVLLLAGAGFDPRSVIIGEALSAAQCSMRGIFLREERPAPVQAQMDRAEINLGQLKKIANHEIRTVEIFAPDGAVVGGRQVAQIVAAIDFTSVTDVVVDCSALSRGIFFPLIKHLSTLLTRKPPNVNLHVFVVHEPETDKAISTTGSDTAGTLHGFKGGLSLSSNDQSARLWLPQLVSNQKATLERIYNHNDVNPHDVCPILPFPATDPRKGDRLIEEYSEMFESVWDVDPRNIIYASEDGPLDIYRTLLRIDETRKRVFDAHGGSLMILSPIGSKVTALGVLMAAMERDFPVVTVEAASYDVDFEVLDRQRENCGDIMHIWLQGEAYLSDEEAGS